MKAAPTTSTADPLAGPEPDAVPDAEGGTAAAPPARLAPALSAVPAADDADTTTERRSTGKRKAAEELDRDSSEYADRRTAVVEPSTRITTAVMVTSLSELAALEMPLTVALDSVGAVAAQPQPALDADPVDVGAVKEQLQQALAADPVDESAVEQALTALGHADVTMATLIAAGARRDLTPSPAHMSPSAAPRLIASPHPLHTDEPPPCVRSWKRG